MQRPADPARLSPVPYPIDYSTNLRGAWLVLLMGILVVINPRPPDVAALALVALLNWLAYWLNKRAAPGKLAAVKFQSPPARAAPGAALSRSFNNYLDLPLLPVLFVALLLWLFTTNILRGSPTFQMAPWLPWLPLPVAAYLLAIGSIRLRGPLRWRCGYDPASDSFYHERSDWRRNPQSSARWPAADFIGIYMEKSSPLLATLGLPPEAADQLPSSPGLSWQKLAAVLPPLHWRLWLAGPAGGNDVLLGEVNHWYRNNGQLAQQLTAELSEASGLPQLYRWPVDENS